MSDDHQDNADVQNNDDHQINNQQTPVSIRKKIHWQLIERRPPFNISSVIRSSDTQTPTKELRKFMEKNNLKYRHNRREHPLDEFESLFNQLNLNNDKDLLDRAQRRDIPYQFQQVNKNDDEIDNIRDIAADQRSKHHLIKRSKVATNNHHSNVVPNVIKDDLAYRRYDQNRRQKAIPAWRSSKKSSLNNINNNDYNNNDNSRSQQQIDSISYMFLENYNDWLNNNNNNGDKADNPAIYNHYNSNHNNFNSKSKSVKLKMEKIPDLIHDDLLNRRLKQSIGSREPVVPESIPFGIPNKPITMGVQTTAYSNVQYDETKKQRYRTRESSPHLINDDLAFRMLRHDVRDYRKEKQNSQFFNNNNDCDIFINRLPYCSSSSSTSLSSPFASSLSSSTTKLPHNNDNFEISLEQLRKQLRPINNNGRIRTSIASSTTSTSLTSDSTV